MKPPFFSAYKIFYMLILIFTSFTYGQVGINTSDPKVTLEIKKSPDFQTNQTSVPPGFITPRVKLSELFAIDYKYEENQIGTIIYITEIDVNTEDLDSKLTQVQTPGYYYFNGTIWTQFVTPEEISIPTEPWNDTSTNLSANANTQNIYQNAQVGIGKSGLIDPNAQLEISSTSKGLIIPRLTKIQRDNIANPTISMLIWNSTENCFNFFKGYNNAQNSEKIWRSLCGDTGEAIINITDCSNINVSGTYRVGTAVNNENYVTLTVNVTQPGAYNIEGITDAGLFFQKSGNFPEVGTYTIILTAVGNPTRASSTTNPVKAKLYNNGIELGCSFDITTILPPTAAYNLSDNNIQFTADALERAKNTSGKTIKFYINVVTPGVFSLKTNTQYGVYYSLNNTAIETTGLQEVTLYSNGDVLTGVPNTIDNIPFVISGTGQNPAEFSTNINVPLLNTNAQGSIACNDIIVNDLYILKKESNLGNSINVTIDVTNPGSYNFSAILKDGSNTLFNFKAEGNFETTGMQTFTAYADGIVTPTVENGTYTVTDIKFNGISIACNKIIDILYPSQKVVFVGNTGDYDNMYKALTNQTNFGPTGTFKVAPLDVIKHSGNRTLTRTQILDYVNNQGVNMFILSWKLSMATDAEQALANFIKDKKGFVFYAQTQGEQTHLKNILDKAYNINVVTTPDTYPVRAVELRTLQNNHTDITLQNPYINGPFGNLINKYIVSDDNNSWIGLTTDSFLASPVLKSLAYLPLNGSRPERNTFIYAPGFMMFPDWGSLHYVNTSYGTSNPIANNTKVYSLATYNGESIVNTSFASGQVINWSLFGNIISESIKYLYTNYNQVNNLND